MLNWPWDHGDRSHVVCPSLAHSRYELMGIQWYSSCVKPGVDNSQRLQCRSSVRTKDVQMSSNQFTGSESRSLNLAWRKSFQNQSGHRQTCIRCSLACMCAVMANLGSAVVLLVIERRRDIFDRDTRITRPLLSTGFKIVFSSLFSSINLATSQI